jgi:hypothetical protein
MRQPTAKKLAAAWLLCSACILARSQGTFLNLDFESASLPVVPPGQDGGLVSSLDAIPGWTAYYATSQTTQVLHNGVSLGAVNISILGPNYGTSQILQGNNSVALQSGLLFSSTRAVAAIAQTGTIPVSALSLQFLAKQIFFGDPTQLVVSIAGQNVPIVALSTTANYAVYGADVSGFSGQTTELRIAALPTAESPYNSFVIDSISFSAQPIPEPNALCLLGLGILFFGCRSKFVTKL